MSINKKTGRGRLSQAEGNHALELFTDRYEFTRLFAEYLNESPREKILFFHGDGGNGKSLLLKFLRQRCCKRFREDIWQQLKAKPDAELAAYIEEAADSWEFTPIPAIIHDFGQAPIGDDRPQDPFYGLLMLRRNLADAAKASGYRLRFPLYDFACVWYFHKTGKLEKAKEMLPAEEMDLIAGMVDALSDTSYASIGKALLGIFGKHLGEQFTLYLKKRGLNEAEVSRIQAMEPESELIDELPCLLAADLNVAMEQPKAPPRIVLFFDTHETFWGEQRHLVGSRFFIRDEWLRGLLAELELSAGVVAVVAGREKPRWAEAPKDKHRIPSEFLDTQLVGHLSAADARDYLRRAGIRDGVGQAQGLSLQIVSYASVAPDEVQPFLLALCVDVVEEAKARGDILTPDDFKTEAEAEEKPKELIERLLKYVDEEVADAVHALSAARAFDREFYFHLGDALRFQATDASLRILTRFSFVWQDEHRGENWYRIHDLLRRLNYEGGNEITRRAHEVLEQHYRERREIAEAIYHANRLDWERGMVEWLEAFHSALEFSRYEQCRILLEVKSELSIQSDFHLGNASNCEGDYLANLAQYEEAKQEYLEAIAAYNQVLKHISDSDKFYIPTYANKGQVLNNLGDLQVRLSQYQDALQIYQQAVDVYDQILSYDRDNVRVFSKKGVVLKSLGDLQTGLSQHSDALQSYQQAIIACEQALNLAPDDTCAYNNKGNALQGLGILQAQLSQHQKAWQNYDQAIATYDQVLARVPEDIYAHTNKAQVLRHLGDLQEVLSQYPEALKSYQQAITVCDQALSYAPDDIYAHNDKGIVFSRIGELQTILSRYQEALQSYQQAVATYDQALELAPGLTQTYNNQGVTLVRMGELQARLSRYQEALQSYHQAIAAYNQVLSIAPDDVSAHQNQAVVFQSIGKLKMKLSQYQEALQSYEQAIVVNNQALRISPRYVDAHNNKGNSLSSLGELQARLSRYCKAIESYEQAITSYTEALTLAPNYVDAHYNKGQALITLGYLQAQLFQEQDALKSWKEALAAFTRSLEIAPDTE